MTHALSTLSRHVLELKEAVQEKKHPIDGFGFTLDDPTKFNPYSREAMDIAGFPFEKGMPEVDGFVYVPDAYEDYLQTLIENDQPHPAQLDPIDTEVIEDVQLLTE